MSHKEIEKLLFYNSYTDVIRLEDEIKHIGMSVYGWDQIEAEDYAARNTAAIWNRIKERLKYEHNQCLVPCFEVIDEQRYMLRWLSKVSDEDAPDLIKQKRRLACRGELLKKFDKKFITPREYEIVSAYLCKLAGSSNAYVTKFSGDAGIDFLALVPASTQSHLFPSTSRCVRIVGQAKYWDSPIQRSAIQQLDDTLQDIRHGNYKMISFLPDWFFSEGPIIGCFLSHSHAQSGAIAEAKQRGIIIGDTRDIVEHLVLDERWSPESTSIEEHVKNQIKGYTN